MKKAVFSLFCAVFYSTSIFAAPSISSTAISVTPLKGPEVAAALDGWMEAQGNSGPARVILQGHIADGANPATHTIVVINPSVTAGEKFSMKVQGDEKMMEDWTTMMSAITPVSKVVATSRSAHLGAWGDVNDDDVVWHVHMFSTNDPASAYRAIDAWQNSATGKKFPGQAHLFATVAGGPGSPTHFAAIGYKSEAEMEEWAGMQNPSGDWARFIHTFQGVTDYHGANLVRTWGAWGKSISDVLK